MRYIFLLCSLLACILPAAQADGLRFKGGRLAEKKSVLRLTNAQMAELAGSSTLHLTEKQVAQLQREARVAPHALEIHANHWNDCTCFLRNAGFRYSERRVDVPHDLLVGDAQYAQFKQMTGQATRQNASQ